MDQLAEMMDRYHAALDVQMRKYHGMALLYGEKVAREWLDAQPRLDVSAACRRAATSRG